MGAEGYEGRTEGQKEREGEGEREREGRRQRPRTHLTVAVQTSDVRCPVRTF